jgi:hypothetical protein
MTSSLSKFLLLIISTLLGLGAGWLAYNVITYRIPSGAWYRIGTLPEKPVEIVGSQVFDVFIRMTDGNVYVCGLGTVRCEPASPESIPSSRLPTACDSDIIFAVPQPPGEVVDEVEYYCRSHFGLADGQFNFVALTDKSIWTWSNQFSEYEFINEFAYLGAGIVLGFLVGYVILILRRRKDKLQATIPG